MAKRVERALRVGKAREGGPAVVVQRRAADRLRAGHLWVYRTDIEELLPSTSAGWEEGAAGADGAAKRGEAVASGGEAIAGGALVTVVDSRGIPLGTALYSAASEIALRLVSREAGVTRAGYLVLVRERLEAALRLREELAAVGVWGTGAEREPAARPGAGSDGGIQSGLGAALEAGGGAGENNAGRLVFSEADGLPGIVADRYNELVVVQLLTQGTAQADVRSVIAEVLGAAWFGGRGVGQGGVKGVQVELVAERPDPRVRELEQLAMPPVEPLYRRSGADGGEAVKLATVFTINGLRFHFDAGSGQKTGAFLDQRQNYAAAARYGRGQALDVCTYQGGFALHLATRCERVTGVDASRAALEVAERNLALNAGAGLRAYTDWIEADAFELLREFEATGRQYDTIVLDPPAFAKSKRAAEGALRGYKEMNLRAIKMLRPGGTLVTCSCSHHVPLEEFTGVVAAAASDAGRRVQVLEVRGAAPDHPAVLTLPETSYLKCLICRVG